MSSWQLCLLPRVAHVTPMYVSDHYLRWLNCQTASNYEVGDFLSVFK